MAKLFPIYAVRDRIRARYRYKLNEVVSPISKSLRITQFISGTIATPNTIDMRVCTLCRCLCLHIRLRILYGHDSSTNEEKHKQNICTTSTGGGKTKFVAHKKKRTKNKTINIELAPSLVTTIVFIVLLFNSISCYFIIYETHTDTRQRCTLYPNRVHIRTFGCALLLDFRISFKRHPTSATN